MNDQPEVSLPEFLSRLDAGWADLQAFIGTLTPEQITVPTDPAGWTVKDHLMHLAVWEDGMNGALERQPRHERMGLDLATWNSGDYDAMNAIIQRAHQHKTLAEVLAAMDRVHAELRRRVAALSTADLLRPYSDFQLESTSTGPIVGRLVGNTYEHYEEHIPWMQEIADKA